MLALQRHATRAGARVARFSALAAAQEQGAPSDVLQLATRELDGSSVSRRLRRQGFLPGVLYGEGEDGSAERVLVAFQTREFERMHRKLWTSIENQVFQVQVGDQPPVKAIMRDVQFDVVTDIPLTVNFLRYKPGRTVSIPITYLNEEGSPGLKRGGYINHIHHALKCTISTDKVPATLQVDVNGLHVGDKVFLEAIDFPEGVVPVVPEGSLVAKIAGRRGLIPRVEAVEEVVEEKVVVEEEEEFDDWNDIF